MWSHTSPQRSYRSEGPSLSWENKISRFVFEAPFTPDGRAHGQVTWQCMRKTILTSTCSDHLVQWFHSIWWSGSIPFSVVVPFHSVQLFHSIQWFHSALVNTFKLQSGLHSPDVQSSMSWICGMLFLATHWLPHPLLPPPHSPIPIVLFKFKDLAAKQHHYYKSMYTF